MFSSKSLNEDVELSRIKNLNIPPFHECCYTPCFCEENVWKLCEHVKKHQPDLLPMCYAVFISNKNQSIPLWYQRSGRDENKLAIWDYHVIFVYKPRSHGFCLVYDLDTILPFPFHFDKYTRLAFQLDRILHPIYDRYFRVIPAEVFLNVFASDRSRMKNPDGSWIKDPPVYPCISTPESTNNIDDFISMDPSVGVGEVLNLQEFLYRFQ